MLKILGQTGLLWTNVSPILPPASAKETAETNEPTRNNLV